MVTRALEDKYLARTPIKSRNKKGKKKKRRQVRRRLDLMRHKERE